jgi:hypothetical protein
LKGQKNYIIWKKIIQDIIITGRLGYYIIKDHIVLLLEDEVFPSLYPGLVEEIIACYANNIIIKTSIR